MLVLTRKIGEQVIIGDNVKVTIVSVGPGRVKIGIEAPSTVSVDRAEIHDKKRAEQPAELVGPPVASGSTAVARLHNRIAAKLPVDVPALPAAVVTPVDQTPAPIPTQAIIRTPRLPRKPR